MVHIHHRRSIRLPGYDYSGGGTYFVTMVTHNRESLFGEIRNGVMGLNEWGCVIEQELLQTTILRPNVILDTHVVMPNHVHAIIQIRGDFMGTARRAPTNHGHDEPNVRKFSKPIARSLPTIVGAFKSACTKRIRELSDSRNMTIWQRNYHEHIIRDHGEYDRIHTYILQNPYQWHLNSSYIP